MSTRADTKHPASKRRWIGVGLIGLTAAGAATQLWLSHADARASNSQRRADQRPANDTFTQLRFEARGRAVQPCSFAPGTRMAYTATTRTEVELDMKEVSAQVDVGNTGAQVQVASTERTDRALERDWVLELEAVALDDDGASVLAGRISDRGIRAEGDAAQPSAQLADTFLIRVDPRCSIREFGWRHDADLEATREQQVMAAGLGFWAPRSLREPVQYGASSFDTTGSYTTNFLYEAGGHIRGEVVGYAAAQLQIEVLSSKVEVELEPGEWFASLTNERDLVLSFHGVEFGTHFRSTRATRTALGDFAPVVELDDGGWRWGRAPTAEDGDRTNTSFDPQLAELPLDEALLRYRELVASGSISQYGPLLRDWLRANPEQTGRLIDELLAGGFEDSQKARGGIFYALGTAGTPESRAALVGLVGAPEMRPRYQVAAAHALAMVDNPTPDMLDALRGAAARNDLHEVERGSLTLAMGSFAHASMAHNPELAAAARAEISTWLDTPADGDTASLRHSLLAAGNAGHDELVPSIASYMDHEDPAVRKTANHALRQMSPEQAYPELERGLEREDDQVVRTSALEAATEVARTHERLPSERLTEIAIDTLGSDSQAERGAAISLLDQAAKRGHAGASAALHQQLRAEIEAGDGRSVAALGQGISGHWTASKSL